MGNELLLGLDFGNLAAHFIGRINTHRLISVAVYGDSTSPRFAALWQKESHPPPQEISMLVPIGELLQKEAQHAARGFDCTVGVAHYPFSTLETDLVRYLAVWTRPAIPKKPRAAFFHAKHLEALTGGTYPLSFRDGYRTVRYLSFERYQTEAFGALFCGVADETGGTGNEQWHVSVEALPTQGSAGWEATTAHRVHRRGYARPEMAAPVGEPPEGNRISGPPTRVATLWRGDTFAPWPKNMNDPGYDMGATVVGPLHRSEVAGVHTDMQLKYGWKTHRIAATGAGETRFFLTFTRRNVPLPKQRFVTVNDEAGSGFVPPFRITKAVGGLGLGPSSPGYGNSADLDDDDLGAKPPPKPSPRLRQLRKLYSIPENYIPPPLKKTSMDVGPLLPPPGPPPPTDPADPFYALDKWVFEQLEAYGFVRGAQVAVARGGKLICVRSYTYAEEGYPIANWKHKFRVGSISKALTAMAVVEKHGLNGDLARSIPELFEIQGNDVDPNTASPSGNVARLNATTLEMMLRHRSGMPDHLEGTVASVVRGNPPALAGDSRMFADQFGGATLYFADPGTENRYVGFTLRLMGELIGKSFKGNVKSEVVAMQEWWSVDRPNNQSLAQPLPRQDMHYVQGHYPVHDRDLGLAYTWKMGVPEALLVPAQWYGAFDWSPAAGSWGMSSSTLVRILCGMEPASRVKPLLTPAKVALLSSPGPDNRQGLIWAYNSKSDRGVPYVQLVHNGETNGGTSMCAFETPTSGRPSYAASFMVNANIAGGLGESHINAIVERVVAADVPLDVDLFPDLYDDIS